jgi:predicted RNA-binding Zn-ribbon protein involved in translation (DUF1610 family)
MGFQQDLDVAGFTNSYSQLGKRIPAGEILVDYGVELSRDEELLIWPGPFPMRDPKTGKPVPRQEPKIVKPTEAMFSRFIDLHERPAADIREFASQWGRLHVRRDGAFLLSESYHKKSSYREPTEVWRSFVSRARAVLSIASSLAREQRGMLRDWEHLTSLTKRITPAGLSLLKRDPFDFRMFIHRGFAAFATESIETQRVALTVELNLWMKLGGLGLYLGMDQSKRGWQLELFGGGRLLAALALQLALTVSKAQYPQTCSGCKRLYIRTQKAPKAGEDNYCPNCGKAAALEAADKRRRERSRQARLLRADGLTVREIAEKLGVKNISTINHWIAKGK